MIELTFGESPAGALKQARKLYPNELSASEVAPLSLYLDIGDISGMDDGLNKRREVLENLFGDYPGVPDSIWNSNLRTLGLLNRAKETREQVRVWYSPLDPGELCAFYHLCHLLRDGDVPLLQVRVAMEYETEAAVTFIRGSGELDAERLGALASGAEAVNSVRRGAYAALWQEMVRENAPLRAVVNGRLLGVPEDFYDFVLRRNIPEGEFVSARLLGKTLSQLPGVGDRWLFSRMKKMLERGELTQLKPAGMDHPYSAVLRKGGR